MVSMEFFIGLGLFSLASNLFFAGMMIYYCRKADKSQEIIKQLELKYSKMEKIKNYLNQFEDKDQLKIMDLFNEVDRVIRTMPFSREQHIEMYDLLVRPKDKQE